MNRLIVVSNRLPFALDSTGEDLWTVTPAVGGLVSAIEPVLRADEYLAEGAVHVFTVDKGKIIRFREYVDLDAAL